MTTLSLQRQSDDVYLEPVSDGGSIEWRREPWWITLELRNPEIHHATTISTFDLQPTESYKLLKSCAIYCAGELVKADLRLISENGDDEPFRGRWKVALRPESEDESPEQKRKGALSYVISDGRSFQAQEEPLMSLDVPIPAQAFQKAVAEFGVGTVRSLRLSVLALLFRSKMEKAFAGPDDIWTYHVEKTKSTNAFFSSLGIQTVKAPTEPTHSGGKVESETAHLANKDAVSDTEKLSLFQKAVLERLRQIQVVLAVLIIVVLATRFL